MIKEFNQACEKLNHTLGVSVKLPNPKKKTLKAVAVYNFMIGAGLVAAGSVLRIKSCALLGGISMISSLILRKESKNKSHEP